MLLLQAKAVPARRNPLRKDRSKLPRRRNSRSNHSVDELEQILIKSNGILRALK
jgi:hypothetical protein